MTEIDVDAIPLDPPTGAKIVEADAPARGLTLCRCIDCDYRVDLGEAGNGCERHPVDAHRDIARRRYCAHFKPKGPNHG